MYRRRLERRVADPARRTGVAVLAAGLLAGCGSSRSTVTVPGPVASAMNAHLENVRAAAGRQDPVGATRELAAFAVDVADQKAAGHLSSAAYAALEAGIGRARARIGVEVVAPAQVVTGPATSSLPPVSQAQQAGDAGPGKIKDAGKGKGKGKGSGKGNGGDGGD